ncbi:MAG: hypothetical protein V4481_03190 [Patescibacteria group bacterium]
MKNSQRGFITIVIAIIVGVAIAGYVAWDNNLIPKNILSKNNAQQDTQLNTTTSPKPAEKIVPKSSAAMNFNDVKDYDTCMNYAKNIPTNFDIVFAHGSDVQEVRKFAADFKATYPRAEVEVSTEQDFLDHALAAFGESIKTASALAEYKNRIIAQASSMISVKIPTRDLGSLQSFSNFVTSTLNKYTRIKFQQYAGSSPETTLSRASGDAMQKLLEKQCEYKYKTLSASERSLLETKNIDDQIQAMIMSSSINGNTYFSNHDSYAPGPLAINSGICSDTGMYGLKKAVDSVKEVAGEAYCYASQKTFAFSAPLKSNPSIGYCTDSTFFNGTTTSPSAASKGYCVTPKKVSQNISACKDKGTARDRWICVGNMVDPFPLHIGSIIGPFATPVSEKITFCKTYSGVEADYCYSSIVKAGWGLNENGSPDANAVCNMVSNQTSWFKKDCLAN